MDIISFNEASTANGRIESFIENPDSTSGVVTVPKTIAAGETITIPTGRVAILPDLQVDGDLVIDGDLFIPTGSMTSQVVQKVASTDNAIVRFNGTTGQVQDSSILIDDNGNLNITGVGKRITGDFSNSTTANRVAFQSSTNNSNTSLSAIPNGTATEAYFAVRNNSDADNASNTSLGVTAEASVIGATKTGTGSYLPLAFFIGGSERMRINTDGKVGIGTNSPLYLLDVRNTSTTGTPSDSAIMQLKSSNRNCVYVMDTIGGSYAGSISNYISGVIKSQLLFDSAGNILSILPNGGLGYGTGSGGAVTQLTSKGTAVTLNKPTGQIAVNSSALAGGASVYFDINNSLVTTNDNVLVTLITAYNSSYRVEVAYIYNGRITLRLTNVTAGSLSESPLINVVIVKGANS